LAIDGRGRLSFDAPEGVMTDGMVHRIRSERDALLAVVERIEERAAIIEHDAGMARIDAERYAMAEVLDGAPEPMPRGVICPGCKGRRLIDDPGGCRCWDCGRLAWLRIGKSIVRADYVEIDLED
jgi:hypothetical protein